MNRTILGVGLLVAAAAAVSAVLWGNGAVHSEAAVPLGAAAPGKEQSREEQDPVLARVDEDPATTAPQEVPEIQGWVSDHAGLLSPDERAGLELLLSDFEARTQAEFAVLTVSSTGGETIEEFSNRVAREWGVGKKGLANGLLVVVAEDGPADADRPQGRRAVQGSW